MAVTGIMCFMSGLFGLCIGMVLNRSNDTCIHCEELKQSYPNYPERPRRVDPADWWKNGGDPFEERYEERYD